MLYAMHAQGYLSTLILNSPGHNEGQGVALNRMFQVATGDPIVKIDHDLVFDPSWLTEVQRILEDERVGLLGLFKYAHDPVDWRKTGKDVLGVAPEGYGFHTHICGSAMVIPRWVWKRIGPFDQRSDAFGEDWMFQRRVGASDLDIHCALPDRDLVVNNGFGIGPSTVVVAPDTVAKIHHGPRIFGP